MKMSNMVRRVKALTGEIEWYTPRRYLDAAIYTMGAIDLDPASSVKAQKHVQAKKFFTTRQNGLKQKWHGRVFLNPPYAMPHIRNFTNKLIESFSSGHVSEAIMVTNNATDTEWFHSAMNSCDAICFTRGRISFLNGATNGELFTRLSPTHGQTFFYFGPNANKFSLAFAPIGKTLFLADDRRTRLKMVV